MEPNILFFVVGLKQVSERFPLVANYFPAGEAPYWDDHIRRKKGKMGGPPSHLLSLALAWERKEEKRKNPWRVLLVPKKNCSVLIYYLNSSCFLVGTFARQQVSFQER